MVISPKRLGRASKFKNCMPDRGDIIAWYCITLPSIVFRYRQNNAILKIRISFIILPRLRRSKNYEYSAVGTLKSAVPREWRDTAWTTSPCKTTNDFDISYFSTVSFRNFRSARGKCLIFSTAKWKWYPCLSLLFLLFLNNLSREGCKQNLISKRLPVFPFALLICFTLYHSKCLDDIMGKICLIGCNLWGFHPALIANNRLSARGECFTLFYIGKETFDIVHGICANKELHKFSLYIYALTINMIVFIMQREKAKSSQIL